MGLFSDIFGIIDELIVGGSYYKEDSIEWCDKAWRKIRHTERGEARLIQIGERIYRQLSLMMALKVTLLIVMIEVVALITYT